MKMLMFMLSLYCLDSVLIRNGNSVLIVWFML